MNELAFWHVFGPHGGETPEQIVSRKRQEIQDNKWTLWSFQRRKPETMQSWISAIQRTKPKHVLVLCSASKGVIDPYKSKKKRPPNARQYREHQNNEWQDWHDIPKNKNKKNNIKVPHPWRKNGLASAFKVSKIHLPAIEKGYADHKFDWLRIQPTIWQPACDFKLWRNGKWRYCRLPERAEHLLKLFKFGNGTGLRPICAVLELQYPYIVEIRK